MKQSSVKKLLIAFLSAALLVCAFSFAAMANDGSVDRYVTTACTAYAQPNASSAVVKNLAAGEMVHAWVEVKENGFTNVMVQPNNDCAWVPTAYLSKTQGGSTPTPTPVPSSGGDRYNTGGGALVSLDGNWNQTKNVCMRTKVYSQPTTAGNPAWTMEAGTAVFIDYVSGGFAHITSPYNGYIVSTYVDGWNVPTNYPSASNWWYLGYDWSEVYNYDYYRANQPDVVRALGTGENALIQHFVEHGMKEGRRGNGSFDPASYIYNHQDLYKKYGLSDLSIYYKHACGIPF